MLNYQANSTALSNMEDKQKSKGDRQTGNRPKPEIQPNQDINVMLE